MWKYCKTEIHTTSIQKQFLETSRQDFCTVVMSQLYNDCPRLRPRHSQGCKNSDRADEHNMMGRPCSGLWESTNQGKLSFWEGGLKETGTKT